MGNLAKWLSLPTEGWPPDYFRLLGLSPGEGDAAEIEARVFERMELIRPYQLKYPDEVTEGMNLLAQAMVALCDPKARTKYEKSLGLSKPEVVREKRAELPIAKLVEERKRPVLREDEQTIAIEPLPVARQVATAPLPDLQAPVAAPRKDDRRRKPVRERVFLRRFIQLLRQFEALLEAPLRKRNPQRDARTLQTVCQSILKMWNTPQWALLQLEGEGDRLLSIAKILARYPSFDYLVSHQLQDVHHDVSQELMKLESRQAGELYERQGERQRRRHRWRHCRRFRRMLWEPERLIAPIGAVALAIGLFRWIF